MTVGELIDLLGQRNPEEEVYVFCNNFYRRAAATERRMPGDRRVLVIHDHDIDWS